MSLHDLWLVESQLRRRARESYKEADRLRLGLEDVNAAMHDGAGGAYTVAATLLKKYRETADFRREHRRKGKYGVSAVEKS